MHTPKSSIFEEIGTHVVERLKQDNHFTAELVQQIAGLFESGDIADQNRVLNVLEGMPNEDA